MKLMTTIKIHLWIATEYHKMINCGILTPESRVELLVGLTQLLSPNIAQTLCVRGKYVTVISQPIKKTERNSYTKS